MQILTLYSNIREYDANCPNCGHPGKISPGIIKKLIDNIVTCAWCNIPFRVEVRK